MTLESTQMTMFFDYERGGKKEVLPSFISVVME